MKKFSVVVTALDIVTVEAESKEKAEAQVLEIYEDSPGYLPLTVEAEECSS